MRGPGLVQFSLEAWKERDDADRDDDMGAISIPCDDFESFDGLYVSDDVVEGPGTVLRCDSRVQLCWLSERDAFAFGGAKRQSVSGLDSKVGASCCTFSTLWKRSASQCLCSGEYSKRGRWTDQGSSYATGLSCCCGWAGCLPLEAALVTNASISGVPLQPVRRQEQVESESRTAKRAERAIDSLSPAGDSQQSSWLDRVEQRLQ